MTHKLLRMLLGATAITVSSNLAFTDLANAAQIKVTVENIAPAQGFFFSQTWVGFHDGTFDVFELGQTAPEYLERLAEDADVSTITTAFANSNPGGTQGTVFGPTGPFNVFESGDIASRIFTVDSTNSRYFSYGSMGLPSNDAFIANDNPFAFEIFDSAGKFIGADFTVTGAQVWDAGTEVNDEIPANTAALGQAAPNTGVDENGLVTLHPGFLENGNILAARPFADFTQPSREDYAIARIKVEQVPEPTSIGAIILSGGMLLFSRRHKRKKLKV